MKSFSFLKRISEKSVSVLAMLALLSSSVAPLFAFPAAAAAGGTPVVPIVAINEFSSNGSSDWVELYNTNTANAVDISGWNLSDSTSAMKTFAAGTSIAAGGFLVEEVGSRLNDGGDTITLFDNSATPVAIDTVAYGTSGIIPEPGSGQSAFRTPDGGATWDVTSTPTKGASNVVAAQPVQNLTTGNTFATIQAAVEAASAGDTLVLTDDLTVPTQVNVNKSVTIDGQGHTVSVSGTGYRFLVTAASTTLKNMDVTKTDRITGEQDIVGIQANNVTIDSISFSGQYVMGDNNETSRALEVSSVTGFVIKNSSFKNLRQPAYINAATGSVTNNHADGTKGWVAVQDSNVMFSGNTWGTNATDIAIIQNNNTNPNHYTCPVMAQIEADNNNPAVNNQVLPAGSCSVENTSRSTYFSTITDAVASSTTQSGDTLLLTSNLVAHAQQTINKQVTLNGSGHTVSADFTKTDNSNNSILGILANGVTVSNLVIDGAHGTNLHGINVFDASNVSLNGVTTENNGHSGLTVNGSSVTVSDLTTAHNGWGGVDVDKAGAVLTINGVSHHNESLIDVYVDDTAIGKVIDTNNQYGTKDNVKMAGDRVYNLMPAVPTNLSWTDASSTAVTNGGYTNTYSGTASWSDASANVDHYVYKYWNDIASSSYNGEAQAYVATPTATSLAGVFNQGEGTHHFAVSACDAAGICSAFSAPFTITYDKTAPSVSITSAVQSGESVSFTGTVSDPNLNYYYCYLTTNQTVTVATTTYTAGQEIHLANGASARDAACSTTWAKGQTSFTGTIGGFDITGVPTGNYTINLVGVDLAKNSNAAAPATHSLSVSQAIPATPTITHPTARAWFNTAPILDSWTPVTKAADGGPITIDHYQVAYAYDDGHSFSGSTCSGEKINNTNVYCRDTNGTSRSHAPSLTEEGGVTVWVRAVDTLGQVGGWSASVHYYYDHTAPSTSISVSPVVNGAFTVSGTATDNLALNRAYVQLVERSTSNRCGGATLNLITSPLSTAAAWSQAYDLSTLTLTGSTTACTAGDYAANVSVTDMAGNSFNPGWTHDFTVDMVPVYVTTGNATNETSVSATLNAVNGSFPADKTAFWWGTTTASSFASSTAPGGQVPAGWVTGYGPNTESASGAFSLNVASLSPNTTYYFVAWSYVGGVWYPGSVQSFTTAAGPTVTTEPATITGTSTAVLNATNGTVAADNTAFWWGETALSSPFTAEASPGHQLPLGWSAGYGPSAAGVAQTFSKLLTGLTQGTTYYYTAWVRSGGVWYPGIARSFATVAEATSSATVVVTRSDLANNANEVTADPHKWFFWNDNTDLIDNTYGTFVSGPATAPLQTGSAEIVAPKGQRPALATFALAGTPLKNITSLGYSTYRSAGSPALDLALQFDVNTTGITAPNPYQGRLVFEPYLSGASVADNSWQQWNPLSGTGWWFSRAGSAVNTSCTQASPCTWAQVLAEFPNIGVSGGTYFRAGQWIASDFVGNVDDFTFTTDDGVAIATTTYDFEPTTATVTPQLQTTSSGGGTEPIVGDLNHDGKVDILDLALLMYAYNHYSVNTTADLNNDKVVNLSDLAILLSHWTGS